ncbi:MAG: hypothetical protein MRY21_02990 [Simkaniaceae bacterium]|nr:hypothetical protein [Simkaniaceae bacterium]
MKKIAMYLAGTIKKDHENPADTYWSDENIAEIRQELKDCEVTFLNPALRMDDFSDMISIFGRDMLQVFTSNFVFVDARDRRGLGVGAEMMWAKVNRIPVITWAPRNSHYNKDQAAILDVNIDNYLHPFVAALSDKIVETPAEGAAWMRTNPKGKGLEAIAEAMELYRSTQFEKDLPMKEALEACAALMARSRRAHPTLTV